MSNIHALDFLRTEHTLTDDGAPKAASSDAMEVDMAESSSPADLIDFDSLLQQVSRKPALEKQFDVIHFLQAHRSAGCLAPSVIYQCTAIDLLEADVDVANMLQHNPKIRVENVPDPENPALLIATYAYQAKYPHVNNRTTLLAQINRCQNGVPRRDLEDAYDGVSKDLDALITAGDVLALANTEDKDKILFPRGEAFLVELDGILHLPSPPVVKKEEEEVKPESKENGDKKKGNGENSGKKDESSPKGDKETKPDETTTPETNGSKESPMNGDKATSTTANGDKVPAAEEQQSESTDKKPPTPPKIYTVCLDIDPTTQVRRGEAIQVGGQWFRVSSAVKEGPLKDQPARAQAPLSVASLTDLSKRNEQDGYIRPLNEKILPLDAALSNVAIQNLKKAKEGRERLTKAAHGRSGGVASQLLGSHAHASNPTTLAASFGTAAAGSRKRPKSSLSSHNASGGQGPVTAQQKKDAVLQARAAAADPHLALYSHARRHGCTKDVRSMYIATRSKVPHSEAALRNLLIEHKLLEPEEQLRRPRLKRKANVDNDGKPKKRRYYERKNQRMTNTHLEGTEIGAILRRAQEKQQQGESVGDGGM